MSPGAHWLCCCDQSTVPRVAIRMYENDLSSSDKAYYLDYVIDHFASLDLVEHKPDITTGYSAEVLAEVDVLIHKGQNVAMSDGELNVLKTWLEGSRARRLIISPPSLYAIWPYSNSILSRLDREVSFESLPSCHEYSYNIVNYSYLSEDCTGNVYEASDTADLSASRVNRDYPYLSDTIIERTDDTNGTAPCAVCNDLVRWDGAICYYGGSVIASEDAYTVWWLARRFVEGDTSSQKSLGYQLARNYLTRWSSMSDCA